MNVFFRDIKANKKYISNLGILYLAVYRYGNWVFYKVRIPIIRHLLWFVYKIFNLIIIQIIGGGDIPARAKVGGGLMLPHGVNGVIIHGDTVIGSNVKILHQVTIGLKDGVSGVPHIGDGVVLNAGAKIIGKLFIGDGSIIGANAVVTKDIPPNVVAVGVPAKILREKSSNK